MQPTSGARPLVEASRPGRRRRGLTGPPTRPAVRSVATGSRRLPDLLAQAMRRPVESVGLPALLVRRLTATTTRCCSARSTSTLPCARWPSAGAEVVRFPALAATTAGGPWYAVYGQPAAAVADVPWIALQSGFRPAVPSVTGRRAEGPVGERDFMARALPDRTPRPDRSGTGSPSATWTPARRGGRRPTACRCGRSALTPATRLPDPTAVPDDQFRWLKAELAHSRRPSSGLS